MKRFMNVVVGEAKEVCQDRSPSEKKTVSFKPVSKMVVEFSIDENFNLV